MKLYFLTHLDDFAHLPSFICNDDNFLIYHYDMAFVVNSPFASYKNVSSVEVRFMCSLTAKNHVQSYQNVVSYLILTEEIAHHFTNWTFRE